MEIFDIFKRLNLPIDFAYFLLNEETNSLRAVRTNRPGDGTLLRERENGGQRSRAIRTCMCWALTKTAIEKEM